MIGVKSSAHHAFGAEFDPNRPLILRGPVVKIEWTNPHAWFHIEHTNDDGTKTVWMVEAGTPNTLLRRGIHRNSVPIGTEGGGRRLPVEGSLHARNGRNMTFANGQTMFMGSSGTGAPRDGADPTEGSTEEEQQKLEAAEEVASSEEQEEEE